MFVEQAVSKSVGDTKERKIQINDLSKTKNSYFAIETKSEAVSDRPPKKISSKYVFSRLCIAFWRSSFAMCNKRTGNILCMWKKFSQVALFDFFLLVELFLIIKMHYRLNSA